MAGRDAEPDSRNCVDDDRVKLTVSRRRPPFGEFGESQPPVLLKLGKDLSVYRVHTADSSQIDAYRSKDREHLLQVRT